VAIGVFRANKNIIYERKLKLELVMNLNSKIAAYDPKYNLYSEDIK
jgi:hypothetical protein